MPDEGKIEWSKNVRVGYLDQHTVLEQGHDHPRRSASLPSAIFLTLRRR